MKFITKNYNAVMLTGGLLLASAPAIVSAETSIKLDYRHSYSEETEKRADRLKTYISTDSLLLELEATTASGGDSNWLEDKTISSYDIGIFYPYRYNKNLVFLPGFDYITTTDNQQYIPSLRINYMTDNKIRLQTRYKQIINEQAIGDDERSQVRRIDFWLGYGTKAWDFQYQVSFGKELNNDVPLYDNTDHDYWQNIRIRYQQYQWQPYIELGDVKVGRYDDQRQVRYRVGLMCVF
ncbi:oligogalacturonate-specific porin KdgM family protein [Psychromonas aquimarina]|uniref:oligogalacturonate-specific porin KdgM family protein n=1 Tax=Psychromonas aquimarina TaxID=444919 RepID=UPI00040D3524|nr:oligogalacturonate-specific porin KdgM family protein [Psychromonas aquimarina]